MADEKRKKAKPGHISRESFDPGRPVGARQEEKTKITKKEESGDLVDNVIDQMIDDKTDKATPAELDKAGVKRATMLRRFRWIHVFPATTLLLLCLHCQPDSQPTVAEAVANVSRARESGSGAGAVLPHRIIVRMHPDATQRQTQDIIDQTGGAVVGRGTGRYRGLLG